MPYKMTPKQAGKLAEAREVEALREENKNLKAAIAKMVKERKEETCAYCFQQKPELMICCHDCYMEP